MIEPIQAQSKARRVVIVEGDLKTPGVLLSFGLMAVAGNKGIASETAGIIETADGQVHLVPVECFKFQDFES